MHYLAYLHFSHLLLVLIAPLELLTLLALNALLVLLAITCIMCIIGITCITCITCITWFTENLIKVNRSLTHLLTTRDRKMLAHLKKLKVNWKSDRVKMGGTKNNPLFVTPQPAVFKRPLSCQSVITFCISSKMKKRLYKKTQNPPQNIWKYIVYKLSLRMRKNHIFHQSTCHLAGLPLPCKFFIIVGGWRKA